MPTSPCAGRSVSCAEVPILRSRWYLQPAATDALRDQRSIEGVAIPPADVWLVARQLERRYIVHVRKQLINRRQRGSTDAQHAGPGAHNHSPEPSDWPPAHVIVPASNKDERGSY
jgi:hypothetical protein